MIEWRRKAVGEQDTQVGRRARKLPQIWARLRKIPFADFGLLLLGHKDDFQSMRETFEPLFLVLLRSCRFARALITRRKTVV